MQDELTSQILEQLRAINQSLKTIVKRLDRIESAVKKSGGDEEFVILPRQQPAGKPETAPPEFPPIIKSALAS